MSGDAREEASEDTSTAPLSRRRAALLLAWTVSVLALYALARLHFLDALFDAGRRTLP